MTSDRLITGTPNASDVDQKYCPHRTMTRILMPDARDSTSPIELFDVHQLYCYLSDFSSERRYDTLLQIELSCCLERRIWPHFPHQQLKSLRDTTSVSCCFDKEYVLQHAHSVDNMDASSPLLELIHLKSLILVISLILNEKFRQRADIWSMLKVDYPSSNTYTPFQKFRLFLYTAWFIFCHPHKFALSHQEAVIILQLLIHVYQSLENDIVRQACMPLCSLASWLHLSEKQQAHLLHSRAELRKPWKAIIKRYQQLMLRYNHVSDDGQQGLSGFFQLKCDSQGLTLDDRFMLLERDALVMSFRWIIRLVEVDLQQQISRDCLVSSPESLASIPKTLTDVFLGSYYLDEVSRYSTSVTPNDVVNVEHKTLSLPLKKERKFKPSCAEEHDPTLSMDALRNENPRGVSSDTLLLLERFLEFNIDLLAQLPTRRFFRPTFDAHQLVVRIRLSSIFYHMDAGLVRQLLAILFSYDVFEIDDDTGEPLHHVQLECLHYKRLEDLQIIAFKDLQQDFPLFKQMAVGPISKFEITEALTTLFNTLSMTALLKVADGLDLVHTLSFAQSTLESLLSTCKEGSYDIELHTNTEEYKVGHKLLVAVLVNYLSRRHNSLASINKLPLFPTETLLWDPNIIPTEHYQGDFCLALPKLNLQFLTIRDYLMRNFHLFRLESAYEIREHLEETIARMEPRLAGNISLLNIDQCTAIAASSGSGSKKSHTSVSSVAQPHRTVNYNAYGTRFQGHSRWGAPVDRVSLVFVKPPILGEVVSAEVRAEIVIDLLNVQQEVREEWDTLRPNDVLFLITLQLPASSISEPLNLATLRKLAHVAEFPERFGVLYVRGCEVVDVLDEEGQQIYSPESSSYTTAAGTPSLRRDPYGTVRTYRVLLDCNQHYYDMNQRQDVDIYSTFNLLVRRPAAENNFKAVLGTIRRLMNDHEDAVIPMWLHDLFLGYGDPGTAQYVNNPSWQLHDIDFYDTFLDEKHLHESFHAVTVSENTFCARDLSLPSLSNDNPLSNSFLTRITFEPVPNDVPEANMSSHHPQAHAKVTVYSELCGPLITNTTPRRNTIRFTRSQVDAIRSGIHPGLTLIVGPPGTGKTDTAVQIVNLLHRNIPSERILLIAHSNQALNDLFEKILALNIDERYLLRLGAGEKELRASSDETLGLVQDTRVSTRPDFSIWGRVNHMLRRRVILLKQVDSLASSLCVTGDMGASCETAIQFYRSHITARIQRFWKYLDDMSPSGKGLRIALRDIRESDKTSTHWLTKRSIALSVTETTATNETQNTIDSEKPESETTMTETPTIPRTVEEQDDLLCESFYQGTTSLVACLFPFSRFFTSGSCHLFPESKAEQHLNIAKACFSYLVDIFEQVEECHAFELLRNLHDRKEYLLTRHVKVAAMTCTHAAIARQQLVDMRFSYGTLIIEEAAQILEIETFIPMVLQKTTPSGLSKLNRVILIGDHYQLPPVVKNRGFQHYSRLDQSMFTRFIRLQVPYIQLDLQGRCRPILRDLFGWRYTQPALGDLPLVKKPNSIFLRGNPGFYFTHQWVNVPDYKGRGESTVASQKYMYQNLGEAEFVVAVFMYMRLLGYPANGIALLTTYNGQKHLLKEIVSRRCGWNPALGWPAVISTVDRFQGQQANYVLLSLVRTQHLGYLRDVRRMIVAVSRARLGLYVFGRLDLMSKCPEWDSILQRLVRQPLHLQGLPTGALTLLPHEVFDANNLPHLAQEDSSTSTEATTNSVHRSLEAVQPVVDVVNMWTILQSTTEQALIKLTVVPQEPSNNLSIEPSNHLSIELSNHPSIEPSKDFSIEPSNDFSIEPSNEIFIQPSTEPSIETSPCT